METYFGGRKYIDAKEWATIFNGDYTNLPREVKASDIHRLYHHYEKYPTHKAKGMEFICADVMRDIREKKSDFMEYLRFILSPKVKTPTAPQTMDDEDAYEQPTYEPEESNMDFVNQELLDRYQTEGRKTIKLTLEQYNRIFK